MAGVQSDKANSVTDTMDKPYSEMVRIGSHLSIIVKFQNFGTLEIFAVNTLEIKLRGPTMQGSSLKAIRRKFSPKIVWFRLKRA